MAEDPSLSTLILTRKEIEPLLDATALLPALREAFAAYSLSRQSPAYRFPVPLPRPSPAGASAMLLAPGLIEAVPAYSVKVHAKFPGQEPAIQGVIILHDILTGHPLAILESTLITAVRTGLVGALAADVLAQPDASSVALSRRTCWRNRTPAAWRSSGRAHKACCSSKASWPCVASIA